MNHYIIYDTITDQVLAKYDSDIKANMEWEWFNTFNQQDYTPSGLPIPKLHKSAIFETEDKAHKTLADIEWCFLRNNEPIKFLILKVDENYNTCEPT